MLLNIINNLFMELEKIALEATKNILEKNLNLNDEKLKDKKIILVYDIESPLSRLVSE
jgi:hypothetical protein